MQLRRFGVSVGIVDMIDRGGHVVVDVAEQVAPKRDAKMAEIEADAGADGFERRGKFRQRLMS